MTKADAREIYDLLREIKADVAAIRAEGKADHERIDKIEAKVDEATSIINRMIGAKGVVAVVLSALGAFIMFVLECIFHWFKGGNS